VSAVLPYLDVVDGIQAGSLGGFEVFRVLARLRLVRGLLDLPLLIGEYQLGGLSGALGARWFSRATTCVLNRLALQTVARRSRSAGAWRATRGSCTGPVM
jgi:hypothetical protein